MRLEDRITFSIKHHFGKSVAIFPLPEWKKIIRPTGEPTILANPPNPINKVESDAAVVAMAASGEVNTNPGFDIVRKDQKDFPHIYNIDHYIVIENLHLHPSYKRFLTIAGLDQDLELENTLLNHVFIVGPYKNDNHWVDEIPQYILNAQRK